MNDQGRYVEKTLERDASLSRFSQGHAFIPEIEEKQREDVARTGTSSTIATSSSSTPDTSEAKRRPPPQHSSPDVENLRHHSHSLSRIQTQRSQHSLTVGGLGGLLRSRTSRASRPLPEFGAGKPYPPPLPSQEDYVVEFDGEDDPLHAQNWPLRKKLLTAAMLVSPASRYTNRNKSCEIMWTDMFVLSLL